MRRIATTMAGAVLALTLMGSAVAGAADAPPASSDPGRPAHYDKTHHDNPGENNCNKFRGQCDHDAKCDCWYRSSEPAKSNPDAPADSKSQPHHSAHSAEPGPNEGAKPAGAS